MISGSSPDAGTIYKGLGSIGKPAVSKTAFAGSNPAPSAFSPLVQWLERWLFKPKTRVRFPHGLQHEMPRSKPDRRDVRMPSAGAAFEKRVFYGWFAN